MTSLPCFSLASLRLHEHSLRMGRAMNWIAFVSLTLTEVTWERVTSPVNMTPTDWPVGMSGGIFLIHDSWLAWETPVHYGQGSYWKLVLACLRKQADSKQWEQGLFLGHWLALGNLCLMLALFVQPEYRGRCLALTQLDRSCFPNAHGRPAPFWVNIENG